jgi:anti-sigma-K factor RskA
LSDQVNALVQSEASSRQQAEQAHSAQADVEKQLAAEKTDKAKIAADLASLQKVNALSRMEVASLRTSIKAYEDGVAVIVWDSEKQEGKLRMDKMPPVKINKDYQLWVLDKVKGPVSAGVIKLDDKGATTMTFKPIEPVTKASKFALSIEKEGGVPKKSEDGPIIFLGTP